jgi:two-component system copper resistance phosphate regulon response regulator CusR
MRRHGLVTTQEHLIEAGWGYLADVKATTLDVYIHGLRTKLELEHKSPRPVIRTIHGTGYVFQLD